MKTSFLPSAFWTRPVAALMAAALAALLSSCSHFMPAAPEPTPEPTEAPVAEKKPPPEPVKPPPPSPLYEWYGSKDYVSHIVISINEQKARFFNGDEQVGWTTIASGVHKYPTPVGTFTVIEKVKNKKSNLYGKIYNKNGKLVRRNAKMGVHRIPAGGQFRGASMPYFLRLTNDGIGMHAGPIPRPGNRASHGCIRMPKQVASVLYSYVDLGTPVKVEGNGPTYASYLAKQRRSRPKSTATAVAAASPVPDTQASSGSGASETSPRAQITAPADDAAVASGMDAVSESDRSAAVPIPASGSVAGTTAVDSEEVPTGEQAQGSHWKPMTGFAPAYLVPPVAPAYLPPPAPPPAPRSLEAAPASNPTLSAQSRSSPPPGESDTAATTTPTAADRAQPQEPSSSQSEGDTGAPPSSARSERPEPPRPAEPERSATTAEQPGQSGDAPL